MNGLLVMASLLRLVGEAADTYDNMLFWLMIALVGHHARLHRLRGAQRTQGAQGSREGDRRAGSCLNEPTFN